MSYSVYVASGSGGSVTFSNDYAGSTTISAGSSQVYSGYLGDSSFTAIPASGYEFYQWAYRLDGYSSTQLTSESNPFSFSEGDGTFLVIRAEFVESGGGGGGEEPEDPDPPSTGGSYYYTCYDLTNGGYVSGYSSSGVNTSASSITRPTPSGYTYQGYIYHDSFSDCLWQYNQTQRFDDTGTTCTSHNSSYPYVMFFYTYSGGAESTLSVTVPQGVKVPVSFRVNSAGTYTLYTEGSLNTIGYLTYANVTSNPESNYIDYNDNGGSGYNFSMTDYLSAGSYKIWVGAYGSYSGSTTLKISPRAGTFTGSVGATGQTTAVATASFANGDSGFAYYRYVRVKIGNTWGQFTRETTGIGGSSSEFTVNLSSLSAGTPYSYEIRLYYSAYDNPGQTASNYTDTNIYCNGTFTTNQPATALMIYINGWKNCMPYVYTSSGWKRAYSKMYINGWKGS